MKLLSCKRNFFSQNFFGRLPREPPQNGTPKTQFFEWLNKSGVEDTRLEAKAKDTKKNPRPRPRTAFPRTGPLEAKDRNARGQGQGPKTQAQVFSKKKGLQNNFSGNLQFIGVARIFDWGGLNHKLHAMASSKICLLALNQDFGKGRGLKLI